MSSGNSDIGAKQSANDIGESKAGERLVVDNLFFNATTVTTNYLWTKHAKPYRY